MQLQNIIFPEENFDHKEMYFRGGNLKGNTIILKKDESVSFDTYFNSFSYTKYRDYTNVQSIVIQFGFKGKAIIKVCVYDGEETVIAQVEAENEAVISVNFDNLPANGILYTKIYAVTNCSVSSCAYVADCFVTEVNVCIGICTYRREEYVRKNLDCLRSFDFRFIKKVFVSDNGNTLDCNKLSDDLISVVHNKNYGGSGGFTRCMIEAFEGKYSHIIVMDDDVVFHPEILERMTTFLSVLNSENKGIHISAAMLSLSTPYMQYEAGAKWDGKFIAHLGHNFDVRNRDVLLKNTSFDVPDYGAWWCFCLPVDDIRKNGLSYPFFIKFDDAEYGIRNRAQGKIVTMNGIAVSHEDFDKKYSTHLEYYSIRNQLVLNAVTFPKSFGVTMRRLLASTIKHLFLYRYDVMPLIFRAFNDFLEGPEFFIKAEDDKLNSEIMAMRTKMQSLSDIEVWGTDACVMVEETKSHNVLSVLTLGGHIIPFLFLKKKTLCAPLSEINAGKCFGYRTTIQYQLGSPEGAVFKRNVRKFFYWFFKSIGLAVKLCFRYGKAKKQYITEKHRITSMEFWKKRLEI